MDTKNDGSEIAIPLKYSTPILGIHVKFWVCIYLKNTYYIYIYTSLLQPKRWMEQHNRMQLKGHLLHVLSAVDFVDPGAIMVGMKIS